MATRPLRRESGWSTNKRSIAVATLATTERWWNGPHFLENDETGWPTNRIQIQYNADDEEKKIDSNVKKAKINEKIINKKEVQ